jgi:hypothetical protein
MNQPNRDLKILEVIKENRSSFTNRLFDCAFQPAFRQILNFFFSKIECGLYFLDRFDVLNTDVKNDF